MKRILLILLLFSWNLDAQTIFRVNNSPGVTGVNVYTTIQAAHDAASDGDIIYVEPGVYGLLTCSKKLKFIGPGFFLNENEVDAYNKTTARILNIFLESGSDGCQFYGVEVSGGPFDGLFVGNSINSVLISRCKIDGEIQLKSSSTEVCSNWTIVQSYCNKIIKKANYNTYPSPSAIQISNNLLTSISGLINSTIANNTFRPFDGIFIPLGVDASDIHSNVLQSSNCDSCTPSSWNIGLNNNIFNNVVVFSDEGTGKTPSNELPNGNLNAQLYEATFVITDPNNDPIDKNYQLALLSPAKGIGVNGSDAGAFGGVNPYILAGQIPYPIIKDFKSTGTGNASVPLQIDITVKGNN